jgi:hypothetical protein
LSCGENRVLPSPSFQQFSRPLDNMVGQPGNLRNIEPVALLRRARRDFVEKCDFVLILTDFKSGISDARNCRCKLGKLVIMCREDRLGFNFLRQSFRHRLRNRLPI